MSSYYGLTPRRKDQVVSPQVEAEAWKCNARNRGRYAHLLASEKNKNVAMVAVASELVRGMWIIGRMAQREMANNLEEDPEQNP